MSTAHLMINSHSENFAYGMAILPELRPSVSSWGELKQLIMLNIKKESSDAFEFRTDIETLVRKKRNDIVLDTNSIESLLLAYNNARAREEKLNHSLSRLHMEYKWYKTLFREGVEFAEDVKEENGILAEKLEKEINLVHQLRERLRTKTINEEILSEELEDMRATIFSWECENAELCESIGYANVRINEQEKVINRIKDEQVMERESQDMFVWREVDKLGRELKQERELRKTLEKRLCDAENCLVEAEKLADRQKNQNEELRLKLKEQKKLLSRDFIQLFKEEALKDMYSDKSIPKIQAQDFPLQDDNYKQDYQTVIPRLDEVIKLKGISLTEELRSSTNSRSESFINIPSQFDSLESSATNNANTKCNVPDIADVFLTYLYITASAVKLHFPDLELVEIDSLMEHV